MKKLFVCLMGAIMICLSLLAQDSTGTTPPATEDLPSWVYIAGGILIGLYEVLARFIPTIKNYSILGVIIKALQAVVPNKSADPTKKLP